MEVRIGVRLSYIVDFITIGAGAKRIARTP